MYWCMHYVHTYVRTCMHFETCASTFLACCDCQYNNPQHEALTQCLALQGNPPTLSLCKRAEVQEGTYSLDPQGNCRRGDANRPDAEEGLVKVVMGAASFPKEQLCSLQNHDPRSGKEHVPIIGI
jgi:hypothetical protein